VAAAALSLAGAWGAPAGARGAPRAGEKPADKPAGKPAPGRARAPEVVPADIAKIREAIQKPGASAVLVNVWATWCDPCREEMPDIVRFYKKNKDKGLRLVLISGDARDELAKAAEFLGENGLDIPSFLKVGDDQAFIDGLDKEWSGTLPVSILYDGGGRKRRLWAGTVKLAQLQQTFDEVVNRKDEKRRKP
jgi:thiol-disulfide isomerase/thioredoxin